MEKVFADHAAPLDLSGLRSIAAPELAAKLLADGRTNFDPVESLSDEAARVFGKHDGSLSLRALVRRVAASRTIPLPLAAAVARSSGRLRLPLLNQPSDDVAAALATHAGPLELEELTPSQAAALAAHADGPLSLDGVAHCTAEAEEAIAAHPGPVSMAGLRGLTTARLAEKLCTDGRREFGKLVELSPQPAAVLARLSGPLFLNELGSISAETAAVLAVHVGDLSLNGLETLSIEAATALADHRGELSLRGIRQPAGDLKAALDKHSAPVWLGDD